MPGANAKKLPAGSGLAAPIRNVAHAERKRARDSGHDFRLRVGVRGNGISLRELESKHEQAVFSRVAVEYARFSPRRNRRRRLRPFYILRPKYRVIHALEPAISPIRQPWHWRLHFSRLWPSFDGFHRFDSCESLI
jgi:hypothetical protein